MASDYIHDSVHGSVHIYLNGFKQHSLTINVSFRSWVAYGSVHGSVHIYVNGLKQHSLNISVWFRSWLAYGSVNTLSVLAAGILMLLYGILKQYITTCGHISFIP